MSLVIIPLSQGFLVGKADNYTNLFFVHKIDANEQNLAAFSKIEHVLDYIGIIYHKPKEIKIKKKANGLSLQKNIEKVLGDAAEIGKKQ